MILESKLRAFFKEFPGFLGVFAQLLFYKSRKWFLKYGEIDVRRVDLESLAKLSWDEGLDFAGRYFFRWYAVKGDHITEGKYQLRWSWFRFKRVPKGCETVSELVLRANPDFLVLHYSAIFHSMGGDSGRGEVIRIVKPPKKTTLMDFVLQQDEVAQAEIQARFGTE